MERACKEEKTRNRRKSKLSVGNKLLIYNQVLKPVWAYVNQFWGCTCKSSYLLSYSAITTCYRSWPELIYGAIRHEVLQLGANFGYPAFLDSHQPIWHNAGEAVVVCDNHHLTQIRRLYELGWSYPYEPHDPAIEDVVF